ncbi:MAG TPA: glycosyltransferase [Bryobacteraceae bacterium]|nr:glycosyltransferase [Bryobacteraceae bacterium]
MPQVTIAIPTLAADDALAACLDSLRAQTFRDFEVIVIDNSGQNRVQEASVTVIVNERNAGFGAAINQAFRQSAAPYFATLNDDTIADANWLGAVVRAMEQRPEIGMCAPRIVLAADGRLDSAGMLVGPDGSSKQRGHLQPPSGYNRLEEILMPSGCAALYRREMLEEIGLFDEEFFLYCEDTDLGLRARWAAWECVYVPDARIEHRYSHSAGRASPLKAYYVERNRLFVVVKNFPLSVLWLTPFYSLARYFWHGWYALRGQGAAAAYRESGNSGIGLLKYVAVAHLGLVKQWPQLWRKRKAIRRRLTSRQYCSLLRRYAVSPRQVAAL